MMKFFYHYKIIDKINEALYESVWSGEISNIIFDTYNREIERYGENTIEDAETLFWKKSEFTLLDKKYREFKPKYLEFTRSVDFLEERTVIMSNIGEINLVLRNIIDHHKNQSLEISLQSFFSSIFHMNINRLFVSNQRLFEMVIYDYLLRYYKIKLYIQ